MGLGPGLTSFANTDVIHVTCSQCPHGRSHGNPWEGQAKYNLLDGSWGCKVSRSVLCSLGCPFQLDTPLCFKSRASLTGGGGSAQQYQQGADSALAEERDQTSVPHALESLLSGHYGMTPAHPSLSALKCYGRPSVGRCPSCRFCTRPPRLLTSTVSARMPRCSLPMPSGSGARLAAPEARAPPRSTPRALSTHRAPAPPGRPPMPQPQPQPQGRDLGN